MITDQIPPSLPDVERSLLGAMLLDDDAVARAMEIIDANTFYKPVNQTLFTVFTDMYNANIPFDIHTIIEQLQKTNQLDAIGGIEAINALMGEATTSANIEYHCKLIKEKAILRKLLILANVLESTCYDSDANPAWLLDTLMAAVFEIKSKDKNRSYSTMMELMLDAHDEIMKRIGKEYNLFGISTGFKKLNDFTDGWQNGDLIIIAALTSQGKTALALNLARNAVSIDIPIAIFSMEMAKVQLGKRFIASEARIDTRRKNYSQGEITALSDASNRQSHLSIYVDDSSGLTHPTLYAKMKILKNERNIKLAIVDHLQLMAGINHQESRRLQIEDITRHLKGYAKDLDIPIILLSQLSRDPDKQNRRPRLSDLRESGSIEQDADVVIFIHEPEINSIIDKLSKYGTIITEEEAGKIKEIIIGKQRNGPTGTFYLYWHDEITRFDNLEY